MPNRRRSDEATADAPRRRAARGFYTGRAPHAGQGRPCLLGRMVPVRMALMLISLVWLAPPLVATEATRDPGAFFDLDCNLVARYTGATGDSDEFILLGLYVVDGVYREMTFSQLKRNPPAAAAAPNVGAPTQAAR